MHNKVVYRIARGLRRSGHVVLRFNYRGVNLSEGEYAHGEGELEDARVALGLSEQPLSRSCRLHLRDFPSGRESPCVGPAMRITKRTQARGKSSPWASRRSTKTVHFLETCVVPRIFIQSTHDEFGPVEELQPLVDALTGPKQLIWIEAKDHFFSAPWSNSKKRNCNWLDLRRRPTSVVRVSGGGWRAR